MKIAIPTDDRERVSPHAGRCHGFLVYDIAEGVVSGKEYRPNPAPHAGEGHRSHTDNEVHGQRFGMRQGLGNGNSHMHGRRHGEGCGPGERHGHRHGHGQMAAVLSDCDAVIALGMGPPLQQDFAAAGLEVYFTRLRTPDQIADTCARGEFVDDPRGSVCKGGHHHHGE